MNECTPIEEDHDIHDCDKHATCTNNFGSFTCKCNNGWKGDGVVCENIGAYIFFNRAHIRVHHSWSFYCFFVNPNRLLQSNVSLDL